MTSEQPASRPADRLLFLVRRATAVAGLLLLATGVFGADTNVTAPRQELLLTFIHINDPHGQMTSFPLNGKEGGGYARLATLAQQIRATNGAARSFLIHAGDEFSVKVDGPHTLGTALSLDTHGAADITVMNALHIDMWTPGNGEFYGGLPNLQAAIRQAQFSTLTANVTQRETKQPLGKEFIIEQAGPVKVAFLGLGWIRPETLQTMPLTLSDPIATAKKLVPELRRQADVVVAVTHIGLVADGRLATAVEGIDLILGGHSHSVVPKGLWANLPSGRKTLICQAGDYLRRAGVVDMKLALKDGQWQITDQTARLVALDEQVKPDETVVQLIDSMAKSRGVKAPPLFAARGPATPGRAGTNSAPPAVPVKGAFVDMTASSGVGEAITRHYGRYSNWWLSGLNLVDLDGDGRLDLFLAAHGAGRSLALLNDGRGHFTEAGGSYPPSEIHVACDINEDGKLDLQMTWQDGGGKWWLNESVPGRLNFRDSGVTAGQGRANAMIDLNRDGRLDWLHERPGVAFELGDGKGLFKAGGHLEVAATRNEINIHPGDFNGDGFMDLALHWGRYDNERGKSRLYLNDGAMNFTDATAQAGLQEDGLAIKGVGDVNQDGHLDLIVLENGRPEIYLNDGKSRFARQPGAITGMEAASKPRYVSWGLAVVTDFDNDGVADILWNGRNFLWILRGTGGGKFAYLNKAWGIEDKSAASVDDGLCFGDTDGDGRLDIIGYTGSLDAHRLVKVYHNELSAHNWLRVRVTGAPGNRAAAGAKIRITEPGNPGRLLWFEQVAILDSQSAHGYYSLAPTERHFGLGNRTAANVSVEFYPSGKRVERPAKANAVVTVGEE
jgi:hypothetical protein